MNRCSFSSALWLVLVSFVRWYSCCCNSSYCRLCFSSASWDRWSNYLNSSLWFCSLVAIIFLSDSRLCTWCYSCAISSEQYYFVYRLRSLDCWFMSVVSFTLLSNTSFMSRQFDSIFYIYFRFIEFSSSMFRKRAVQFWRSFYWFSLFLRISILKFSWSFFI